MKTFVKYYDNFFHIELASNRRSKVHAFAYVFFDRLFNNLIPNHINIVNIDCTGAQFTLFSRFVSNSSPSYLLSRCGNGEFEIIDDNVLDFEFNV